MSTIVPPFNRIPEIPPKIVTKLIELINKQIDRLTVDIQKMIADAIKLPEGCACNDPRVADIKNLLSSIQKQINSIQQASAKLKRIISTLTKIAKVAKTIKKATSVSMLLNPVTAPVFIAQQLTAIQDATIVNALNSIKLLKQMPLSLNSTLGALTGPLMDAISKISEVCGNDSGTKLVVSQGVADAINNSSNTTKLTNNSAWYNDFGNGLNDDLLGSDDDFDYNDLLPSEFYRDVNVSESDLDDRSDAIERMLEQQQDLYKSIIEAPSQVYSGPNPPDDNVGKIGDFYVDTNTYTIYGPKMSKTSWI